MEDGDGPEDAPKPQSAGEESTNTVRVKDECLGSRLGAIKVSSGARSKDARDGPWSRRKGPTTDRRSAGARRS